MVYYVLFSGGLVVLLTFMSWFSIVFLCFSVTAADSYCFLFWDWLSSCLVLGCAGRVLSSRSSWCFLIVLWCAALKRTFTGGFYLEFIFFPSRFRKEEGFNLEIISHFFPSRSSCWLSILGALTMPAFLCSPTQILLFQDVILHVIFWVRCPYWFCSTIGVTIWSVIGVLFQETYLWLEFYACY